MEKYQKSKLEINYVIIKKNYGLLLLDKGTLANAMLK